MLGEGLTKPPSSLKMVQVVGVEDLGEFTKTQKALPSDLTKTPKVIAAGYSRTATVSFSMAMQILLKGPVCHCGTVCSF